MISSTIQSKIRRVIYRLTLESQNYFESSNYPQLIRVKKTVTH